MKASERGRVFFKLVVLLTLLLLAGLLYLVHQPLLRGAGRMWVVNDSLEPADAILVLSDDNYYGERAARAAELYRSGWAPKIVASGRMLRPYAGIGELMKRDLSGHGVPAEAIVVFSHQADNTIEEAQDLRGLVVQRGWRRILVVTSNYHTRRTRYIFHRVFPPSITVRVAAAFDRGYDPDEWWTDRKDAKIFFHETVGMCAAIWELRRRDQLSERGPSGTPAPSPAHR